MRVTVITCYKQPDYVRAQVLRACVSEAGHELIVIKNTKTGLLRYFEVALKLLITRLSKRPDAYILTFRGYEFLPLANLLTWPKPLIYDEFVNPLQWLNEPRPEKWASLIPRRGLRLLYRLLLRRPVAILTDTEASAAASAQLTYGKKSHGKIRSLPVSTDEATFQPPKKSTKKRRFQVFFYANMLPLHGFQHVLSAAVDLQKLPMEFLLVGGDATTRRAVQAAQKQGAHIHYKSWIPYKDLPEVIQSSDLCLAGPFGNTGQARLVITGKTYQFLACGAPTIIGKTTSVNTAFKDKKNCLLVPLGNSKALATSIRWAFEHRRELPNIGSSGRSLYEKQFSVAAITPQLQAILRMHPKHNQK